MRKDLASKNENFLLRTKMLNEIISIWKFVGYKRGTCYVNKDVTPTSGKPIFVKAYESVSSFEASTSTIPYNTISNKLGHTQRKYYSRLFSVFKSHVTRLVKKFNFLKNQILNIKNGKSLLLILGI